MTRHIQIVLVESFYIYNDWTAQIRAEQRCNDGRCRVFLDWTLRTWSWGHQLQWKHRSHRTNKSNVFIFGNLKRWWWDFMLFPWKKYLLWSWKFYQGFGTHCLLVSWLHVTFKVGSRRVIFCGGIVVLVMGMIGKLGVLFASMPGPIVGGMYLVMFGVVAAVGISNLRVNQPHSQFEFDLLKSIFCVPLAPSPCQLAFVFDPVSCPHSHLFIYTLITLTLCTIDDSWLDDFMFFQFVDLTSSRNIFVLGISVYMGIVVPMWSGKILGDPETAVSLKSESWSMWWPKP